jgi:hypothetical protein
MKDPLYFSTASWSLGEQLTIKQAREAADTYTRKLGFEGLQVVWSLQNDGKAGLYHLHAVFNLVDPETKKARSTCAQAKSAGRPAGSRVRGPLGTCRQPDQTREGQTSPRARLSVADLRALERPGGDRRGAHHARGRLLADAQAAVMKRVKDNAQHQPTLDAILAGAVLLRNKTHSATQRRPAASCGHSPAFPAPARPAHQRGRLTHTGPRATQCAPSRSPTPPSKCCAPTRTFRRDRSPRSCGSGRRTASGWGRATCSSSTRPRPWVPPGRAIS